MRRAEMWSWGPSRPVHQAPNVWELLDGLAHRLRLPHSIMRPICDRYELAVGVPRADLIEMDYTSKGKPAPWWLRA